MKKRVALLLVMSLLLALVACGNGDSQATDPVITTEPTGGATTEPSATEPPVTEPPVTEPPVTEPPVTEPPVTEPPVTEPPVTEPPVTEPPVTEPACSHSWIDASCTTAMTCKLCGATEGKALGHEWNYGPSPTCRTCGARKSCDGDHRGWEVLTATTDLGKIDGMYYLDADLCMDSDDWAVKYLYTIDSDVEIDLCLNGHTISSDIGFFAVYGNLNIHDCSKDAEGKFHGKMQSAYTGAAGSFAYIYNNANDNVVNIYGGNFEYTGTGTGNGCMFFVGGSIKDGSLISTMNIYDGVFRGGKTKSGGGGCISMTSYSVVNMYGGLITDCSAGDNFLTPQAGGAIQVNLATFNLYGGEISGNKCEKNGAVTVSKSGGFIHIYGGKIINNTRFDGVTPANLSCSYLGPDSQPIDNVKIHMDQLAPDTQIGISIYTRIVDSSNTEFILGDFATEVASDPTAYFVSDKPGTKLVYANGVLSIVEA